MDELFPELNLYLDPSSAVNVGNSAEQNTAALIASSMNSEYEDDWSTTPSSYRDTLTPLTNSSVSSNSVDHKMGFGENLMNNQLIHGVSALSATEVNEERGFGEESLPLLTFNEYEEIRNYTDLDLLDVQLPAVGTLMNDSHAACQPDSIITPTDQIFASNDITPLKNKPKKPSSRKRKKQVPVNTNMQPTMHNMQVQSGSNISALEVNEGCFLGFNEESLRVPVPSKKKKKKHVPAPNNQLQQVNNTRPVFCPSSELVGLSRVTQPAVIDGSRVPNGILPPMECENRITATTVMDPTIQVANDSIRHLDVWTAESPKKDGNILKKEYNPAVDSLTFANFSLPPMEYDNRITTTSAMDPVIQVANDSIRHQDVCTAESPKKDGNILEKKYNPAVDSQTFANFSQPPLEYENRITATSVMDPMIQVANDSIRHQDVWTAESPKKDGNILKKKFVKKTLPQHLPSGETSSSTVERSLVLKPTRAAVGSKHPKAPSYLTLFPMRCKEYPMIYSCNHCVGIFTSIRAGQLHECVKKRRGRKAGTKLKQSYSNNYSDWSLV